MPLPGMNHLSIEQVLYIHDVLIEETGGRHGLRDLDLLASVVGRLQSGTRDVEIYPTLFARTAALMSSIVQNHPFIDGNKRTGISVAGILMVLNGWELAATDDGLYAFTLRVANGHRSIDEMVAWLEAHARRRSR